MPEWMIWMALIWVFFAIRGRHGCGWHGGRRQLRGGATSDRFGRDRSGSGRLTGPGDDPAGDFAVGTPSRPVLLGGRSVGAGGGNARRTRSRVRAEPPKETVEERLRRQFVEGRLTIEEYEARLWEEIGGR